jgi:hypothetical protein
MESPARYRELIASLMDGYDGWALSTSAAALRDVLSLCPPQARVCAWLFECLGLLPCDELIELFPDTGVVSKAWAELSHADASDVMLGSVVEPPVAPVPAPQEASTVLDSSNRNVYVARREGAGPAQAVAFPRLP